MRTRTITGLLGIALLSSTLAIAKDSPAKQRDKIRKMAGATLQDLYKLQPSAQGAIQRAAGYAVFNNMGTNLLLLSTARGSGIAVNQKTQQDVFMKMISAGAGLGVGVKDYRVIFVFETDQALARFIKSGWAGEAQADAAAKAGNSGAAYSGATQVAPGVWVYQITKNSPPTDTSGHQVFEERRPEQDNLKHPRCSCCTILFRDWRSKFQWSGTRKGVFRKEPIVA